jgi:hypothetical protein
MRNDGNEEMSNNANTETLLQQFEKCHGAEKGRIGEYAQEVIVSLLYDLQLIKVIFSFQMYKMLFCHIMHLTIKKLADVHTETYFYSHLNTTSHVNMIFYAFTKCV